MKNQAEIYQALLDGETLVGSVSRCEVSMINGELKGASFAMPNFDRPKIWSIKPKPMEIWVNIPSDKDIYAHRTKEQALSGAKMIYGGITKTPRLFREVIEND